MAPARACSECGSSLAGMDSRAITCSNACRLKRSRRVRRADRRAEELEQHGPAAAEVAQIVRREAPDVVTRVMKEELRPIVREALTEDVLRAIDRMVGLTPTAVAALQADLESDDPVLRQRAYSVAFKYTVGHPALVSNVEDTSQIVVNVGLPRPDDAPAPADEPVEAETVHSCDMCQQEKPESEFVAGSNRCRDCFESWKANIQEQFT